MKLLIHDNLLDVIKSSNTNFSLKRDLPEIVVKSCLGGALFAVPMHLLGLGGDSFINNFSYVAGAIGGFSTFFNICGIGGSKGESNNFLNSLSSNLHNLNICASANDLKNAYSIKKERSRDLSTSRIIETDFIQIPNGKYGTGIVQQHVVGSKDYYLSVPNAEQAKVFTLRK